MLYVSAVSTLLELNGISKTTYTTLDPDVELTKVTFKKEAVSAKGKPLFLSL